MSSQWRVLELVILNTNVGGVAHSMSTTEVATSMTIANAFATNITRMSGGLQSPSVDIYQDANTLGSATAYGGAYWVSPADLAPITRSYSAYDAVVAFVSNIGVPCNYGGLTVPGLSHIPVRGVELYPYGPAKSMVNVHEWLHQVTSFYQQRGYPQPDLDAAANYGYVEGGNDWDVFLSDVLRGRVPAIGAPGKFLGIPETAWLSGRPLEPQPAQEGTPFVAKFISDDIQQTTDTNGNVIFTTPIPASAGFRSGQKAACDCKRIGLAGTEQFLPIVMPSIAEDTTKGPTADGRFYVRSVVRGDPQRPGPAFFKVSAWQ